MDYHYSLQRISYYIKTVGWQTPLINLLETLDFSFKSNEWFFSLQHIGLLLHLNAVSSYEEKKLRWAHLIN